MSAGRVAQYYPAVKLATTRKALSFHQLADGVRDENAPLRSLRRKDFGA
jgi:hypothetical protein